MNRLLVLICVICSVSARAAEKVEQLRPRVIGGNNITIEEVPYQVSLVRLDKGHICGGSIISKNYVLTAGHCVVDESKIYLIHSGSSFSDRDGQVHLVDKVIRHKGYDMDKFGRPRNDIALIKVSQPFEIDHEKREIIELNEDEVKPGDVAYVSGWGTINDNYIVAAIDLQGLELNIMDFNECNDSYFEAFGQMPEGFLCADHSSKAKGHCKGDSGGPLAVDGKQVGIVSWSGPGCAVPGRPGVYTDVSKYIDWIKEHMQD